MKILGFLSKFGGKILHGIVTVAKAVVAFFKARPITETIKDVGNIATAVTAVGAGTAMVVKMIKVHRMEKVTPVTPIVTEPHLNGHGKIVGGHSKKKKKKKNKSVVEQFKEEVLHSRKLYKAMSPEERKGLDKLWKKEGSDVNPIDSIMSSCYHQWDDKKSDEWNRWEEIKAYAHDLDLIDQSANPENKNYQPRADMTDEDAMDWYNRVGVNQIKAREKSLDILREKYAKMINGAPRLTPYKNETEKQIEIRYKYYASVAEEARAEFDAVYEKCLEAIVSPFVEEKPVTGDEGEEKSSETFVDAVDSILISPELPEKEEVEEEPERYSVSPESVDRESVCGCGWVGDRYVIANIIDTDMIPEYYFRDPQPAPAGLGNETAPNFQSVAYWNLGDPHAYATPFEERSHFDWSEFEGNTERRNFEVSNMQEAYSKGVDWCQQTFKFAWVFDSIAEHKPWIYPGHKDYPEFWVEFIKSYWDLVRVVPGLGDYGKVFANPFAGEADDVENMMALYQEDNNCPKCYGLNNPPSPKKVFYEILKYGFTVMMNSIEYAQSKVPELDVIIRNRACIGDIVAEMLCCPPVVEAKIFPPRMSKVYFKKLMEMYKYYPGEGLFYVDEDEEDDEEEMEEEVRPVRTLSGEKTRSDPEYSLFEDYEDTSRDPVAAAMSIKMAKDAGMSDLEMDMLRSLDDDDD